MKVPTNMTRVKLPNYACVCRVIRCVYNKDGVCDEPRINRANSDSQCYRETPRYVIEHYLVAKDQAESTGSAGEPTL